MWVLIILAVHVSNPNDIPGKVTIKFETEQQCLRAKNTIEYSLKFETFKVIAECKKY